jgi:hypothetical protein
MRQFRNTAIFINATDVQDSSRLPRARPDNPVPGFAAWPTARSAIAKSAPLAASRDRDFENFIEGLL